MKIGEFKDAFYAIVVPKLEGDGYTFKKSKGEFDLKGKEYVQRFDLEWVKYDDMMEMNTSLWFEHKAEDRRLHGQIADVAKNVLKVKWPYRSRSSDWMRFSSQEAPAKIAAEWLGFYNEIVKAFFEHCKSPKDLAATLKKYPTGQVMAR